MLLEILNGALQQKEHKRFHPAKLDQTILTYLILRGEVSLNSLTSCLTGLDSTKQVNRLLIELKQSS